MQNICMSTINLKYTLFRATYEMGTSSVDVLPQRTKISTKHIIHVTPHGDNTFKPHSRLTTTISKQCIHRKHQANSSHYFKHMAQVHKINKPVTLTQEGVVSSYILIMLNR